ncbi:uncharacterized protein LOC112682604 isoform X1 [Sipha flava]|uniref:Uncharacterized protein LOC112682604 isoform X1 n=1 Tax=Sipha flava TaxID=143950 RepID=A0A8B8FDR7_9HEMI|nr:uncharacterized protein LOC112682604 isoform X1 [Sipha flava]
MLNRQMQFAVALALFCAHAATAYPTPMERVSGENNYLAFRNSPSRDLERFIDSCDDYDECGGPRIAVATGRQDGPDRWDSEGRASAAKRSSLDRLNGGHTLATKRSSLDRLNGGHTLVARRGSLDRLDGNFISFADECEGDDGCGSSSSSNAAVAKRSLDRLNGGHTMVAKRGGPDRSNGQQHTMIASSRSAEGGYSDRWWSAWPAIVSPRSDEIRDTIDWLDAGDLPSVQRHRSPSSGGRPAEHDAQPRFTWTKDAVRYGCVGCTPTIKSSSY